MIYLVRHGQTAMNRERRLQGSRADAPLTGLGEAQALAVGAVLGRLLRGDGTPSVRSSPMGRARATTAIILAALGLPPALYDVDPRLREIDFGAWTGLTETEVRRLYPRQWAARAEDPWNFAPPGGESHADVAGRAAEWLGEVNVDGGGDVVAVAHGVFGRILRGVVLGLDHRAIGALPAPHDCVFRICNSTVQCHAAADRRVGVA